MIDVLLGLLAGGPGEHWGELGVEIAEVITDGLGVVGIVVGVGGVAFWVLENGVRRCVTWTDKWRGGGGVACRWRAHRERDAWRPQGSWASRVVDAGPHG